MSTWWSAKRKKNLESINKLVSTRGSAKNLKSTNKSVSNGREGGHQKKHNLKEHEETGKHLVNIEFYKLKYVIFYFAKRQLISEKYKYLMVDLLTTKLLQNRIK